LGERWCVGGRSDFSLGRLGRIQASRLPFVKELDSIQTVFASPLVRAIETARPLCDAPRIMPGLEEQNMGVWDGLSFREIMARYPELYAARERDPSLLPDGAESDEEVAGRMREAIGRCLRESEGDIALVSHKGAIAAITGQRSKLGYTSLSVLEEVNGALRVCEVGLPPRAEISDALCFAMLRASGADEALIAHCRAVAALAASRLCPACTHAMLASHISTEPATVAILEALDLHPPINAGMRLGEGSGAVALLPLLDMALAVYDAASFDDLGMDAYEELS
jgi:broad specificity phosphatase PhoE